MSARIHDECQRCGACCRWPGFVRVTETEISRIAAYLELTEEALIQRFTRLTPRRNGLALVDQPSGACVFLDGNTYRIQAVKPAQCTGFPDTWNTPGWEKICRAIPKLIDEAANS